MSRALHVGKPRTLGGGSRTWRVRAYGGTRPRVTLLNPDKGYARDQWYPDSRDETLASLFEETERYLDKIEALVQVPTVAWAAQQWLTSLEPTDLESDTIDNRRSLVNVWIMEFADPQGRVLGALPLAEWTPSVTQHFLDSVADGFRRGSKVHRIGGHRMADLRNVLSGIRRYAHANLMLSLAEDPLAGVTTPGNDKTISEQGHDPQYIHPRVRPQTEAVDALIRAAEDRAREYARSIDPLQLRIGCFVGPRLSEQLGLAVEDLDLRNMSMIIRGAWISPRKRRAKPGRRTAPHWRPWTKNRRYRRVPLRASWKPALAVVITRALGIPTDTPWETIVTIVEECKAVFDAWHDAYVATQTNAEARKALPPMPERHHLFCDPHTGIPWEQESFNDRFRMLRADTVALAGSDPSVTAWPTYIPYRNARHHAATWIHTHVDGAGASDWTVVADIIGDKAETCRKYYALPGNGDADRAFEAMAAM